MKISVPELEERIESASQADDEAALKSLLNKYFQEADESPRPFSPAIELNPNRVEAAPSLRSGRGGGKRPAAEAAFVRADDAMKLANRIARELRRIRYQARQNLPNIKRIVSEGDSWFQYPIFLRDIIDVLSDHDEYAICSLDAAGDTISNMLGQAEFVEFIRSEDPSAFLFSGGGNDLLAGGNFESFLRDYESGMTAEEVLDEDALEEAVAGLLAGYREMIAAALEASPSQSLQIFGHGYDYVHPVSGGKWLGQPLGRKEVPLPIGREIVVHIVDRFAEVLEELQSDDASQGRFHFIDLRRVVDRGVSSWYDELHPRNVGYDRAAGQFAERMADVLAEPEPAPVRSSSSRRRFARSGSESKPKPDMGSPELIVVTHKEERLVATARGLRAPNGRMVDPVASILAKHHATLKPLFGGSEERVRAAMDEVPMAEAEASGAPMPDLTTYYYVEASADRMEEMAAELSGLDEVDGAYVAPAATVPYVANINTMLPDPTPPPARTPDFRARQGYLNPAPGGIDARYAWTIPGGRGDGIQIIDCEWGWRFNHEDLRHLQRGVVVGIGSSDDDHGTAVLGEISGDRNTFGVEGICSNSMVSAASFQNLPVATTIRMAAARLRPGDILLLEIHRPGPDVSNNEAQDGYIAIEWWPDALAAIRYAVARGVIVVEAAGNGGRSLDAAIYDRPSPGFPSSWRNPFNTNNPTSGAILVGAGAPPPGTHGRNIWGPDRSRLDFSNYGRRVDCQGWGREVTTTGYGQLQGGPDKDLWYTDEFAGTSSASPIVVGAIACVQGILKRQSRPLLTPAAALQLLRTTGSPQQSAPDRPVSQRIGNRPNLRQMIQRTVARDTANAISIAEEKSMPLDIPAQEGSVVIHVHGGTVNIHVAPRE